MIPSMNIEQGLLPMNGLLSLRETASSPQPQWDFVFTETSSAAPEEEREKNRPLCRSWAQSGNVVSGVLSPTPLLQGRRGRYADMHLKGGAPMAAVLWTLLTFAMGLIGVSAEAEAAA